MYTSEEHVLGNGRHVLVCVVWVKRKVAEVRSEMEEGKRQPHALRPFKESGAGDDVMVLADSCHCLQSSPSIQCGHTWSSTESNRRKTVRRGGLTPSMNCTDPMSRERSPSAFTLNTHVSAVDGIQVSLRDPDLNTRLFVGDVRHSLPSLVAISSPFTEQSRRMVASPLPLIEPEYSQIKF